MSGVERPPDVPADVISSVYATNVMGVIHITQAILPIFKRRSDGGRGDIVMLGSIAGREPYAGGTVSVDGDLMCIRMKLTVSDLLL